MAEENSAKQRSSGWARSVEEPPSPEIQVRHNHLLAIGIDHYADEHIPDLSNCVNDMEGLIRVLLEDYWFDAGNIRLLRSSNRDRDADESIQQAKAEAERLERGLAVVAEATHENIIAQLRELAQKLTPEDNVIIAYSGHGIYDEVFDEGYWMPSDSEEGNNATYIENSTIRTALNAMKSRHTVLISDSCFSGSLFSSGAQKAIGIPRVFKHASRWGLTAGRRNQTVSDGHGDNSPFAGTILSILGRKQEIWIGDLCRELVESMEDKGEKQTPMGEPLTNLHGHDGGQFVFLPRLASELDHWYIAWRENTRKAYYSFLARYPDGEYEKMALLALNRFSQGKEPGFSEEFLFTYDYLQEHHEPRRASRFLTSVLNEDKIWPLTEGAIAVIGFLQSISEEVAQWYLLQYLSKGGEKKHFTLSDSPPRQDDILRTYHFIHDHYPDTNLRRYRFKKLLAHSYLEGICKKRMQDTFTEQEAEACRQLLLHHPYPYKRQLMQARIELMALGHGKVQVPIFGTYTDPRDGQHYQTVEIDGVVWFSQNFNFDSSADLPPDEKNSWLYNGEREVESTSGRLYTWPAANSACPPGCRLPSQGDWQALVEKYRERYDGIYALLTDGASGMALADGGYRNFYGEFTSKGDPSIWTGTEQANSCALIFEFDSHQINFDLRDQTEAHQVRYIVEASAD